MRSLVLSLSVLCLLSLRMLCASYICVHRQYELSLAPGWTWGRKMKQMHCYELPDLAACWQIIVGS